MNFVMAAALFACAAGTPVRGEADHVGVYFDESALSSCASPMPLTTVNAYVVYSEPSVAEIIGYDFGIAVYQAFPQFYAPPPVQATTSACPATIPNLAQVSVRCSEPIPCGAHTTLLTLSLFWTRGLVYLDLTAAEAPLLPIAGPYVVLPDGSGMPFSNSRALAIIDGGFDVCEGLPTESWTWGAVKGLYR
ncbi:MAG: hypothetical protein IPO18_06730 [bacterium]|nr:hypothetical protein [bacterium]MBK7771113.1 hypothetical protein [bacterium]MBK9471965.1 hypothetical protein [bacterium]